jgi:CHAT domain-containing protein
LAANARALLERLYGLLLAPLQGRLHAWPRLIVVPHGPLHYVPFHALHDGDRYLLQRHEVSYLPGASFLRYCREAQPGGRGVLSVGCSGQGRLPFTVQEAQRVADLWQGKLLLEEAATRAAVAEQAPEARVLHLAAHGDFRADNPLFSGLSLADGWLTTLDIFNLQLGASLVCLSACQTGRSVVAGGDELLGLMRAFLYAGTPSLVLSFWAVEDRSTARLMETFYGCLAEGQSKGAALMVAQREYVEGAADGEAVHPYFWAPFFLVGDTGLL